MPCLILRKSGFHRYPISFVVLYTLFAYKRCYLLHTSTNRILFPVTQSGLFFNTVHYFLSDSSEPKCQLHRYSSTAKNIFHAQEPSQISSEEEEETLRDHRSNEKEAFTLFEQKLPMGKRAWKLTLYKLLGCFSETRDTVYLEKAYDVATRAIGDGRHSELENEPFFYLAYALAKCGLSVKASTMLREMKEMKHCVPVVLWSAVLAHMALSSPGAHLASELLLEEGYGSENRNACLEPFMAGINVTLLGCLLFGIAKKAEQILQILPYVGVQRDATLLIATAHICERNGQIKELKRLYGCIDDSRGSSFLLYQHFYNCLLSCHLKLGDLDSASHVLLDMLHGSMPAAIDSVSDKEEKIKLGLSFEKFCADKGFTRLEEETNGVLEMMMKMLQTQIEYVTVENGVLRPSMKAYAKLVKAFLVAGKIKELASFFTKAEAMDTRVVLSGASALSGVIKSCISCGWLDEAHDLLDEMRMAGIKTSSSLYASLMDAYRRENRMADITALLRDARKARVGLDSSSFGSQDKHSLCGENHGSDLAGFDSSSFGSSGKHSLGGEDHGPGTAFFTMAEFLLQELREGKGVGYRVYDWNNVIHFFCKKKLMKDAEKALKKMKSLGVPQNSQTFHSLITAYDAEGNNYSEVAMLWGEMKASAMELDQELLDSVLHTFARGGLFERANEVVERMEEGNMFVDKYKYRRLFLKYHKTIYRGKTPKNHIESKQRKIVAALRFKRWVGLF